MSKPLLLLFFLALPALADPALANDMAKAREALTGELVARQHPSGGFPYRRGGMPFTDATAWSMLALGPARGAAVAPGSPVARARAYLTSCRRGAAFAVTPADPEPSWMTIPATLALLALDPHDAQGAAAARWLLTDDGAQSEPGKAAPGWPWATGCAPWVEPTTLALLALAHAGAADDPRVTQGLAMVVRNQSRGGGWSLYARHPHVYHTGLVLTALRALHAATKDRSKLPEPSKDELARARDFLVRAAPDSRALLDVAVAALALAGTADPAAAAIDAALLRRLARDPRTLDTLGAAVALVALRQTQGEPLLRLSAEVQP